MSHQTGIKSNSDLKQKLASAKQGSVRLLKISIEDEALTCADSKNVSGSWEEDYDRMVLPLLEEKQPCYILYRLDSQDSLGYQWLFITWSPDFSPVKQKMLFAGTKTTMKQEFGGGQIKDELYGTVEEDVNLVGYHKHLESMDAPPPLTSAEEEIAIIKQNEVRVDVNVSSKAQTMPGVSFQCTQQAAEAVMQLKEKTVNYVQLFIDIPKERIDLASTDTIAVEALPSKVPEESARYHLYDFKHTHEGDTLESIVFIYSMPGYKCPVKERMLYSSCKASLLAMLDNGGVTVAKHLEVDDASELTKQFLSEELHPVVNVAKSAFARPKGPGGRGPKRMTRPTE